MVFKDYQEESMHLLWDDVKFQGVKREHDGLGYSSREVWSHVNKLLRSGEISRASIINFLNAMVDEGVLNYREVTGKGGHRRIYSAKLSQQKLWDKVSAVMKEKLEEISDLS